MDLDDSSCRRLFKALGMTLLVKDPYNNIDMTLLLKEAFSYPTFSHGTNLINKLDLDGPSLNLPASKMNQSAKVRGSGRREVVRLIVWCFSPPIAFLHQLFPSKLPNHISPELTWVFELHLFTAASTGCWFAGFAKTQNDDVSKWYMTVQRKFDEQQEEVFGASKQLTYIVVKRDTVGPPRGIPWNQDIISLSKLSWVKFSFTRILGDEKQFWAVVGVRPNTELAGLSVEGKLVKSHRADEGDVGGLAVQHILVCVDPQARQLR